MKLKKSAVHLVLLMTMALLLTGRNARAEGASSSADVLVSLNGKRIGVQTGTHYDKTVGELFPDAEVEYFNTKADEVAALTGNKIDAFLLEKVVAEVLVRENDQVTYLPVNLYQCEVGMVFPKIESGEALRDQFNEFIRQLPGGVLPDLAEKWFGEDENAKTMPDISSLSAENGTLHVATEAAYEPFEYVRDGKIVGFDIELSAMFCEAYGYGLEIQDMRFDSVFPSVETGKCDFAAAGLIITA